MGVRTAHSKHSCTRTYTRSSHAQELRKSDASNTGYKGVVRKVNGVIQAQTHIRGSTISLGSFMSPEEAALAVARYVREQALPKPAAAKSTTQDSNGSTASAAAQRECSSPRSSGPSESAAPRTDTTGASSSKAVAEIYTDQAAVARPRRAAGIRRYESLRYDNDIVKRRVRVFWESERKWFSGVIKIFDPVEDTHTVMYDDGDVERCWLPRADPFTLSDAALFF